MTEQSKYSTVQDARKAYDNAYASWAARPGFVRGEKPDWKAYERKVVQPDISDKTK